MRLSFALGVLAAIVSPAPPSGGADPVVAPKPTAEPAGPAAAPTVEDLLADAGTADIAVVVLPDDGTFPSPPVTATRTIRYVMIRGVWPAGTDRGTSAVDPIDFELERQAAGDRGSGGDAAWERVDLEPFKRLLNEAAGFADTADADASDAVITAPLHVRTDGGWGAEASHPRLKETGAGELVLFRCPDLDVRPGDVYRYRVRLKVSGPGYAVPRAGAARPKFIAGPQRWTAWSVPTEPVTVEQ